MTHAARRTPDRIFVWRRLSGTYRCILNTLLVFAACTLEQDAGEVSRTRLRTLHFMIERFRSNHGRLPESLTTICALTPATCQPDETARLRDGWGQPISFRASNGEFELRSGGPDLRLMTSDDLLLASILERRAVRRLSGCYRVEGEAWDNLEPQIRQRVSFGELVLDTSVATNGGSGYAVAPTPTAYAGGDAFWRPEDSTSLVAIWTVGLAAEQLILTARDSLLFGQWSIGDDARSTRARGRIVLKRKPCSGATQPS